jgi:hypothetical protein
VVLWYFVMCYSDRFLGHIGDVCGSHRVLFILRLCTNRFLFRLPVDDGVIFGRLHTRSAMVRLACVVKHRTESRHCKEKNFVRHSAIGRLWRHRSTLNISPPSKVSRRGLTPRQNHHHFDANKKENSFCTHAKG